ncbi:MAG: hypothetical protein JOZ78_02865 [Chroococcidiopsidaceae cyanobacterium CP_BM_ER_R8_30]|nr:hypothetical protein [Chroococcidiopsidaceae cyanobacterium CP_BM_ER_R8_30]
MSEINYTANNDARNEPVSNVASARELVGTALSELEARGVQWSEILSTLSDVAQLRGQHELAQVLASVTREVSRAESGVSNA